MILPIIKLKAVLDALLTWAVAEYKSKADENDTWLYDTFNGNIQGNFNVYTEIKGILLRDKKDPNKLETRRMFDTSRAGIPTIHIHMPSEGGGGFNSIGSGYGNSMDTVTTGVVPNEVTTYNAHFGRSFESQYELIITAASTDEVLAIYELLKALFLAGSTTIQSQFEVFEYSGKELMANPDLIPYQIFYRAFNVKVRYEQVVRSIESYTKINEIYFAGKLVELPTSNPISDDGRSHDFYHNDFDGRDAVDAHPIESITGLSTSIQAIIDSIPNELSDLNEDATHRIVTDTEKEIWNGKQDALGFTPENVANKKTTLTNSATDYPSTSAVNRLSELKQSNSPEFANTYNTALNTSAATGGEITPTLWAWIVSVYVTIVAKSVKSHIIGLWTYMNSLATRVGVLEGTPITLVGTAINWDASAYYNVMVTLSANSTVYINNPIAGSRLSILLTQDSTGSRTLSYSANIKFPAAILPVLSTTALVADLLEFYVKDSSNVILINYIPNVK